MPLTLDQISEYLKQASEQATQTSQQVSDMKIGDKVVNEIYNQTDKIQSFINSLLTKSGVITQEEINQLDEQLRTQKQKLLEAESEKTKRNLILYGSLGLVTIGFLWFVTKK